MPVKQLRYGVYPGIIQSWFLWNNTGTGKKGD